MFAFLGLGWGEILVLGVMAVGTLVFVALKLAKGSAGGSATDQVRQLRVEVDSLREENEKLREEIKRLRGPGSASAHTGIKQI